MEHRMSVLFWLYKSKMNKKGLAPIFMRITLNGEKTEVSTGIYVAASAWNVDKGVIKGNDAVTAEKNKSIELFKSKLTKVYNALLEQDIPMSAELLKKKFNNEDESPKTLLGAIQYHNGLVKRKIGVETTLATYRKYESLRKKLVGLLSNRFKRTDIFLKELNNQFIVEFDTFLKVDQGMAHNSAMKDIQFLKKIIHLSIANGWILSSPFQAFKTSLVITERGYLTPVELKKNRKERNAD